MATISRSTASDYETLRKKALLLLQQALDLDERSKRAQALELYKQCSCLLDDALQFEAGGDPETMRRQSQLMIYQCQVTDRISELEVKGSKRNSQERQEKRLNPQRTDDSAAKDARDKKILAAIDPKFQEAIMREVVDDSPGVAWSDIVGLEEAKETLREAAIFPLLRPDLYTGIRAPPKGVLLFGPPGTGKSMLAKAVASESKAKFYHVHVSTLTQKFLGDSEKMVKALFGLARITQPSVIFIDEIDSLLGSRGDGEHEAITRLKNEFFEQMDGVSPRKDDNVIVVGATNRPQSLDDAALRRLSKHIFIPLPEELSRRQLIANLLTQVPHSVTNKDLDRLAANLDGYSGSDIFALVSEAARLPLRELGDRIVHVHAHDIRKVSARDFEVARTKIRASVNPESLKKLQVWNNQYGVSGS